MWPNPQELRIWSHLLKKSLIKNFILHNDANYPVFLTSFFFSKQSSTIITDSVSCETMQKKSSFLWGFIGFMKSLHNVLESGWVDTEL